VTREELYLIFKEIEKRNKTKFVMSDFCFEQQLNFINDTARFKTAVCSRRAGKTISCAVHLLTHARDNPDRTCLYITLDRKNAKRIIWRDITRINKEFRFGFKTNDTDLTLTHPNGSVIYISGAKDKSEIEKFRGLAISLVYIDESQSFRPYIEDLVDDVLGAALFDYNGSLCLIGTPGLVPTGYFHQCATSPEWSHHYWTMFDNPHLEKKSGKKVIDLVHEDMRRMGVDINHPKIQRECFGKWVIDTESMVLHYTEKLNHYDHVESLAKWNYVIGVDIGYHDADAICVIGWRDHNPTAYLLEEIVVRKQGVTELAGQLAKLYDQYSPMKIVMDTGGLGKKIGEELTKRFSLPISAAEKVRKYEFLELLDDALRTGNFRAKRDSAFAQDCFLTEWDMEKKKKGILEISDKYHSDIIDAVLYAYREAMHWIEVPIVPKPKEGSDEHYAMIEKEMFDKAFENSFKKDVELMDDLM
jgi:hypothetical protein